MNTELQNAINERKDSIERIMAEYMKEGYAYWEAMEKAERAYRRSKGQFIVEPLTVN